MKRAADLESIAELLAHDLEEGSYVNLGIGLPTRVAAHIRPERDVFVHSENGILGVAPHDGSGVEDPDLIDAGKRPVSLRPGGSYTSHADSFALIRGGHLNVAVMGAHEVSADGDLANWWDGSGIPGVGGAMDLAAAAAAVFVFMRHTARDGAPKIVEQLTLPVTGRGIVSRIYTELGVFELRGGALLATALAKDWTLGDVQAATGIRLELAPGCTSIPHKLHSARPRGD